MNVRTDSNRAVTAAARQALGALPGLPQKLGEIGPQDFPRLLEATEGALQKDGQPLPQSVVREVLAQVIASLSSDRGVSAQTLLATTLPAPNPPKGPASAVLAFQLGRHQQESQHQTLQLLEKRLRGGPKPVAPEVKAWAAALGHKPKVRTRTLLELAQKAGIQIEAASLSSGLAHFDPASNSTRLDLTRFAQFLQSEHKALTPERLIDSVVAHELIHGLIHARVPNYDYQAMRPIDRHAFDQGLRDLFDRLDPKAASPVVRRMLEAIRSSAPANLPEEVLTYTLTVPELEQFVRSQGQLAPLKALLVRHGLGELV